jgi:hypothetical protein
MQKKQIFQYKVCIETFSGIVLYIELYDSQKKSGIKILKIRIKK